MTRKSLLKIALSSVLALSLISANNLMANPNVGEPQTLSTAKEFALYFDLSPTDIEKLTKNPRSAKALTNQTWLRIAGYYPASMKIDGMTGADTRTAIGKYQESLGQKADGIPHPQWESPLETTVRKAVQKQLKLLGFYTGDIDGRNGTATRNAIRAYEKSVNLQETGTLAPVVLFHLFNPRFLPESAQLEPHSTTTETTPSTSNEDAKQDNSAPAEAQVTEEIAPSAALAPVIASNVESPETVVQPAQAAIPVTETDSDLNEVIIPFAPATQGVLSILTQAPESAADLEEAEDVENAPESRVQLKSIVELEEPLRPFELSRADVDQILIKAKRSDIFFAQVALSLLDLYEGPLDGVNGPATRSAIRAFEKALNQKESGEILPRWQTPLRQIMYRLVQYRLKQDGLYTGEVDGITGSGTRNAIKAYEKSINTEEVGQLTPALLLTLFNTELNEPTSNSDDIPTDSPEDVTDDGTAPVSAEEDKELKADSNKEQEQYRSSVEKFDLSHAKSKEDIALSQLQLAYLGFLSGTVDGLTGPSTTKAVKAFQKAFNLPQTGKLDKKTQEKLDVENINKFQRYLQRTDYMKDDPTGTLGPKTRRAIGILKNRYGYKVNESLDIPAYLILIDEEQGTKFAKEYYENVIKLREAEESIKETQAYLIGFGVLNGKADGKMGPATEKAISTYRSQQGLSKGQQIDNTLLQSFKKAAPKQAQAYLQKLGYPIKPDGIFGKNSKKQLNAFLKAQRKPASDIVTATILMDLKTALEQKLTNKGTPSSSSGSTTARKTGTAPRLQKGLQQEKILSNAPSSTVNGTLQIMKNNSGAVVGCKVKNITMAADWCSGKRNGSSCRVLYRNGRVLSMNCK